MALNHIVQGSATYSTSGSPTIVDGVVSGFSDRNVLVISPTFTPTYATFEIVLKIKTGADVTTAQKIFTSQYGANNENRFGFVIGITGGKITHQSTVDGTAWANETSGTTTLLANTDYYIKCVREGNSIKYFLSTNNTTWTQEISTTFTSPNVNFIITYIGNFYSYVVGEDYAFQGSLDLKGTYIKTNSSAWFGKCPVEVKHISLNSNSVNYVVKDNKLVFADSGLYLSGPNTYTKVGSPTVVDNVASGFSTSDYLNVSANPSYDASDAFEWNIKFTTPAEFATSWLLYITTASIGCGIYYAANKNIYIPIASGSAYSEITSTSMAANTTYIVNAVKQSDGNVVSTLKDANGQIIKQQTKNIGEVSLSYSTHRFGTSTGLGFLGSIDMNETYIKVNDSLWFYGKNYATQNIAPVPSGYTYGTTTTPAIGWVDMRTQAFTATPAGATLGKDS